MTGYEEQLEEIINTNLELDEKRKDEIIAMIEELLPPDAKIILLSHTGSRAFGWSWYNYDFDIHGIYKRTNYWDFVHLGRSYYDINLYELAHIIDMDIPRKHSDVLMNMLNPFYLDDDFPFDDFIKVTIPSFLDIRPIIQQIERFKFDLLPRSALHAYRLILVPLYLLLKGKPKLNVFIIAKELSLELRGLILCRNRYIAEHIGEEKKYLEQEEVQDILRELYRLLDYYRQVVREKQKEFEDKDLASVFKEKIISIYYD